MSCVSLIEMKCYNRNKANEYFDYYMAKDKAEKGFFALEMCKNCDHRKEKKNEYFQHSKRESVSVDGKCVQGVLAF